MRAAIIEAIGNLKVRDIPVPKVGKGEVLVRVRASGLCGTDVHILHGSFIAQYPVVPGHEFAGEVVEAGSDVDLFAPGDRVVVDPNIYCGMCPACKSNQQNQCYDLTAYGVTEPGGFEEYAVIKQQNLVKLSDNLSFEEAAFAEPLSCVIHGVNRTDLSVGDRAVIFGAGPIGLLMAQVFRVAGASLVAVVDISRRRLEIAEQLGVDYPVLGGDGLQRRLSGIAPNGFEVAVDCTGVSDVVASLFDYTGRGGKVLLFGVCSPDARIPISPYQIYLRDIKVIGSFSLCNTLLTAVRLMETGSVKVVPLLSHRLSIEEMDGALDLIGKDNTMKIQVQF